MNNISYANENTSAAERVSKSFEILVAHGKCRIEHGGGQTEFCEGEAAIVPPLTEYALKGEALRVVIDGALLPFREIKVIRDDPNRGIAHAAAQAQAYITSDSPNLDGVLSALGGLRVAYITALSGGERLSPVVETVRDEINKNLSTPLFSLEDSMRKLPLNYDYVRKLFKKEMGVTPHEYLLDCRMKLAKELIASKMGNRYSNYSVSQIAEACGYSEPLYFSRVFKKYFGAAPSEFMKDKI